MVLQMTLLLSRQLSIMFMKIMHRVFSRLIGTRELGLCIFLMEPIFLVDSVIPGRPFAEVGIRPGDKLLAVNGESLSSYNAFVNKLAALRSEAEAEGQKTVGFTLVYARSGVNDTIAVQTDSLFMVGATSKALADYKVTTKEYGFFEAFPAGIALGVNTLKGYVNDMKYVFTAEGAKSVGGFGTIGSIFPKVWDWHRFWEMTAFLSIILAFMNILPIPALDGGHVLFLLYENTATSKSITNRILYAMSYLICFRSS